MKESKTSPDTQKKRELVTTRPALQEILRGVKGERKRCYTGT